MSRGRTGEAIEQFRQAVALKPDFAVARVDLGNALAESGRLDAAIEQYRQALAIKPDYSAARQNLDIAVARRDLATAAIARARAAVAAGRDNVDATAALARLLATCPAESLRNGAQDHGAGEAGQRDSRREPGGRARRAGRRLCRKRPICRGRGHGCARPWRWPPRASPAAWPTSLLRGCGCTKPIGPGVKQWGFRSPAPGAMTLPGAAIFLAAAAGRHFERSEESSQTGTSAKILRFAQNDGPCLDFLPRPRSRHRLQLRWLAGYNRAVGGWTLGPSPTLARSASKGTMFRVPRLPALRASVGFVAGTCYRNREWQTTTAQGQHDNERIPGHRHRHFGHQDAGHRREGHDPGLGRKTYPCYFPKPLWSEQDPDDWWQATIRSVRKATAKANIKPAAVRSIGLSGQMHGSVFLDKDDKVIRRAILWNNQRTAAECVEIEMRVGGRANLIRLVANPALTGFTNRRSFGCETTSRDISRRPAKSCCRRMKSDAG